MLEVFVFSESPHFSSRWLDANRKKTTHVLSTLSKHHLDVKIFIKKNMFAPKVDQPAEKKPRLNEKDLLALREKLRARKKILQVLVFTKLITSHA